MHGLRFCHKLDDLPKISMSNTITSEYHPNESPWGLSLWEFYRANTFLLDLKYKENDEKPSLHFTFVICDKSQVCGIVHHTNIYCDLVLTDFPKDVSQDQEISCVWQFPFSFNIIFKENKI